MAATYSSFITTRFYSPVFNTALFDGAFRIYFAQSYESSALKIYHLLQTEHTELWDAVKAWSMQTREHIFLLIYPDISSIEVVFDPVDMLKGSQGVFAKNWDEGLVIGMCQPSESASVQLQIEDVRKYLTTWLKKQNLLSLADAPVEKQ